MFDVSNSFITLIKSKYFLKSDIAYSLDTKGSQHHYSYLLFGYVFKSPIIGKYNPKVTSKGPLQSSSDDTCEVSISQTLYEQLFLQKLSVISDTLSILLAHGNWKGNVSQSFDDLHMLSVLNNLLLIWACYLHKTQSKPIQI